MLQSIALQTQRTFHKASVSYFSARSVTSRVRRGRRVLFNVPGSDPKKITKAAALDLDVVCLDLEDGVAPNRKQEARENIRQTLTSQSEIFPDYTERSLRINHIGSGLEQEDLTQCILPSIQYLDSLVVPKVETPEQLQFVASTIDKHFQINNLARQVDTPFEIIAAIETAIGYVNLKDICSVALPPSVKLTALSVR
jgi:citrate lyase subunit beta-like protein